MSHWELSEGLTDDYYTPPEVFKALETERFSMDIAAARNPLEAFVDAEIYISEKGLEVDWIGFIWGNVPYGKRGSKMPWVEKMINHGNGLFLMPDRTSADWWQIAARRCADFLTTYNKIKFTGPYGTKPIGKEGKPINAPGTGNTIFAFGERALEAVYKAEENNFGMTHRGAPTVVVVLISPSWKSVVSNAIRLTDGPAAMQEIYDMVERVAPDKIQGNTHWKEKVRQQLQKHFTRVHKGVYKN